MNNHFIGIITLNNIVVGKLFEFDKNTWNYKNMCKQLIIIKLETLF